MQVDSATSCRIKCIVCFTIWQSVEIRTMKNNAAIFYNNNSAAPITRGCRICEKAKETRAYVLFSKFRVGRQQNNDVINYCGCVKWMVACLLEQNGCTHTSQYISDLQLRWLIIVHDILKIYQGKNYRQQ